MTQPVQPAIPVTSTQQARYDRVIEAANEMLSEGGQGALQMQDLAQRAAVSLTTLYRYFPSKEYVLLALSLSRNQAAASKVVTEAPRGDTVRERVLNHLMREFHAARRDHHITAALASAMTRSSREYSSIIEEIQHVHWQVLRHVAASSGDLTGQQQRLLSVVLDISRAAIAHWVAGASSVAEAELQIKIGCELLELPDDVVNAELKRSAPGGVIAQAAI